MKPGLYEKLITLGPDPIVTRADRDLVNGTVKRDRPLAVTAPSPRD